MRLLDTNVISDLSRNPQGRACSRLAAVGAGTVKTSVIVPGGPRSGCVEKDSAKLSAQLDGVLREIEVMAANTETAAT